MIKKWSHQTPSSSIRGGALLHDSLRDCEVLFPQAVTTPQVTSMKPGDEGKGPSPSLDELPASEIAEFLGQGSYLNASLASKAAKELVKGAGRKTYGPVTAARRGDFELLKWLHFDQERPLRWRVCSEAAGGGFLEILKWARENGCGWDGWTCANAAEGGHLEVLKWAVENGCPEYYSDDDDDDFVIEG